MDILISTVLLLLVLAMFTLFTYKAPKGAKAMGALADAACASFLVEAFHLAFFGEVLNISFLGEVGASNGSLGGVIAGILVPLALGVKPVYAGLAGLSLLGMDILPGFLAGYLVAFVLLELQKRVPDGLDLIIIILVGAPLARFIAALATPVVDSTLLQIGQALVATAESNPIVMGIILGGIITVTATAPLSSMALTAMLGLTGIPMAIGALSVFGSSFMNFVLFSRLKLGEQKDIIAVAIEPLTQADVVTANPIPVYVTNFLGGGLSGIIISMMGLVNNTPGTATPIAGFAVMFAYNPAIQVLIAALGAAVISTIAGFVGAAIFKNYKVVTASELRSGAFEK